MIHSKAYLHKLADLSPMYLELCMRTNTRPSLILVFMHYDPYTINFLLPHSLQTTFSTFQH